MRHKRYFGFQRHVSERAGQTVPPLKHRGKMMKYLQIFGAACIASCFIATSATAVTLTFKHTADVDYITYSDIDAAYNPIAGRLINPLDQLSVTYTVDLDQTPAPATPGISGTTFIESQAVQYDTSALSVQSSSGFNQTLSPHKIEIVTITNQRAPTRPLDYETYFAIFNSDEENNVFMFDSVTRQTSPYELSLPGFLALPRTGILDWLEVHLEPGLINAPAGSCLPSTCEVGLSNVNLTITPDITSTPDPVVTPVPLPAPLAMLGLAMVGLFGFGKRVRRA